MTFPASCAVNAPKVFMQFCLLAVVAAVGEMQIPAHLGLCSLGQSIWSCILARVLRQPLWSLKAAPEMLLQHPGGHISVSLAKS